MKVRIVLCHPERASYNGALADVAARSLTQAGHEVEIADLYARGFDPVEHPSHYPQRVDERYFAPLTEQRAHFDGGTLPADVQREIAGLEWADLLILQFPLWWHAQPAMLRNL